MSQSRGLYRREALERLLSGREDAVLPRLARPRVFRFLWLGVLLAGLAAAGAASARLPEYVAGTGVVVTRGGAAELVVLLPRETLPRLRAGQMALVRSEGSPAARYLLERVEPGPLGPDALRAGYGESVAAAAPGPVAVARIQPFPLPDGVTVGMASGSVHPVRVHTGTRRMISLSARGATP